MRNSLRRSLRALPACALVLSGLSDHRRVVLRRAIGRVRRSTRVHRLVEDRGQRQLGHRGGLEHRCCSGIR